MQISILELVAENVLLTYANLPSHLSPTASNNSLSCLGLVVGKIHEAACTGNCSRVLELLPWMEREFDCMSGELLATWSDCHQWLRLAAMGASSREFPVWLRQQLEDKLYENRQFYGQGQAPERRYVNTTKEKPKLTVVRSLAKE